LVKTLVVIIPGVVIDEVFTCILTRIQLDRVQPDDDKFGLALVATDMIALLDIGVYVNFLVAFRTN
jgi:hypothetical protein